MPDMCMNIHRPVFIHACYEPECYSGNVPDSYGLHLGHVMGRGFPSCSSNFYRKCRDGTLKTPWPHPFKSVPARCLLSSAGHIQRYIISSVQITPLNNLTTDKLVSVHLRTKVVDSYNIYFSLRLWSFPVRWTVIYNIYKVRCDLHKKYRLYYTEIIKTKIIFTLQNLV